MSHSSLTRPERKSHADRAKLKSKGRIVEKNVPRAGRTKINQSPRPRLPIAAKYPLPPRRWPDMEVLAFLRLAL